MKPTKLLLGLLAIGLLMLAPNVAHAQSVPNTEAEGRLRGFEGEVINHSGVASEDGVLTIRNPSTGDERTIRLTSSEGQPDFSLKAPGKSDLPGVASPMKPGAGVAVLARQVGGQWMAVEVLVKPEEPTIAPRTGVVIDSNPDQGTITIVTSSGITRTLQLESGAQPPSDGDLVIAFAESAHGSSGTAPSAGLERVTGLTRAADVRDRLESHLKAVTSDQGDLNGVDPAVKANHVESLIELLDHQNSRHFERLETSLDHKTNANQRALIGALIQTGDARHQGRVQAAQVRAAFNKNSGDSADIEGFNNNRGRGNSNSSSDEPAESKDNGANNNSGKATDSEEAGAGNARGGDFLGGNSVRGWESNRDDDDSDRGNSSGSSGSDNSQGSNAGGNREHSNSGGNKEHSNAGGNSNSGSSSDKDKDKDK